MLSILPDVTRKPSLGLPKRVKSRSFFQSGCARTQTRYPFASSTRDRILTPKLGWSTYASPVTNTKSGVSQPLCSISFFVTGKKAIGPSLCTDSKRGGTMPPAPQSASRKSRAATSAGYQAVLFQALDSPDRFYCIFTAAKRGQSEKAFAVFPKARAGRADHVRVFKQVIKIFPRFHAAGALKPDIR